MNAEVTIIRDEKMNPLSVWITTTKDSRNKISIAFVIIEYFGYKDYIYTQRWLYDILASNR